MNNQQQPQCQGGSIIALRSNLYPPLLEPPSWQLQQPPVPAALEEQATLPWLCRPQQQLLLLQQAAAALAGVAWVAAVAAAAALVLVIAAWGPSRSALAAVTLPACGRPYCCWRYSAAVGQVWPWWGPWLPSPAAHQ